MAKKERKFKKFRVIGQEKLTIYQLLVLNERALDEIIISELTELRRLFLAIFSSFSARIVLRSRHASFLASMQKATATNWL